MKPPKVSIIILNWNGWKDTIECLESLYQITHPNYDIIVVDNGSKDESIKKIKDYAHGQIKVTSKFFEYNSDNKPIQIFEYAKGEVGSGNETIDIPSNKKLTIIKNDQNCGFAAGNNIGIRFALKALDPDYVLLLNNDTVVDKKFLDTALKLMEEKENIGIVTGKIYFYDNPDIIWAAGGKIKSWTGSGRGIGNKQLDKGQFNEKKAVEYAPGTMALVRKSVFEKIGFLPECYFGTGEEMEFAVKASKIGYKIMYDPESILYHKVGMSSNVSLKYRYNSWRTRLLYNERNLPNIAWKILAIFYIFMHLIIKLIMLDYRESECFLLALNDHRHKKDITESDLTKVETYFKEKIKSA
jgi:GT2 family glycosyltransferase